MDLVALYRDIVETSPDGIWVFDLDGATVYANPEIARIHGITPAELAGLTVLDTLDEPGRAQFVAHLADVRAGRTNTAEVEVQWVRSDGTIVWMLCSESPLVDTTGATTAVLHRYTDYTDRRLMLESLRASEDALEDQIAQNNLMQAVASASNQARSLEDVLVHCRSLVLLHDDWERARAFVPASRGSDRVAPFRADAVTREEDGDDPLAHVELALAQRCFDEQQLVWDELKLTIAFPVRLEDVVYAVIVITSAPPLYRFEMIENMVTRVAEQLARVAERERYQADLGRARDDAMAASRQKSDFLATMSHEIRTPLNGVIGLNDLLMRTGLTPEQERLVSGAHLASRTLLELINDILDFSKIEAGALDLERLDFEVRPLLDNVAGMLAQAARDKRLDLVVSCHPDVPAVLAGDPTRLAQVVTNLVSNAVKFTQRGGVVVRATLEPCEERLRLRVEVADTGVGVAPEKLRGLFDPFTQADSSTTRVYGGTGLGLAISREIVEAMGGRLEHAPNPGGGSVFAFTALLDPADDLTPPVATGPALSSAQPVLAGRRALVVDDTGTGRRVLDEHLAWWGIGVDRVESVAEAEERLSAAEAPACDFVVLDLQAPVTDAVRLAVLVHTTAALDGVGVLALTPPGTSPEVVTELSEGGVDEVLARPVLSSNLLDALRRLVPGGSTERPAAADGSSGLAPGASRGWLLVVEDNPVNQMVATGLLAALGYTCDTAEDGLAAIEAARTGGFDAILMDVQMPHMDGYSATRHIRTTETGPRRPIIAMTAAAVEGERERCLAAGMDDYLTKPIDATTLAETLARWLPATAVRPEPAPAPRMVAVSTLPDHTVRLDVARLEELRELDDVDEGRYVARAIDNFLLRTPVELAALEAAVGAGDANAVRSLAHRFAGAALNVGAPAAGAAGRELELLAVEGRLDDAPGLLHQLEEVLEEDLHALRAYRGEMFPAHTA